MSYLNIGLSACDTVGFLRVMYIIKMVLNIARYAVPIIVIVMIIKDLFQNVLNPDDKDSVHKMVMRLVAAAIVFLIPTIINLVLSLVDYIFDNKEDTDYKASSCYTNANRQCIDTIDTYASCGDVSNADYEACMSYRSCNSYKLSGNCSLTTVVDENCKSINTKYGTRYFKSGYRK